MKQGTNSRQISKVISLLLVLAMLMTFIPSLGAAAAGNSMSLSSASCATGGTAALTLTFSADSQFTGVQVFLDYDSSALTLTLPDDLNMGSYFYMSNDSDSFYILKNESMDLFDAGEYSITLNFHVASTASAGDYTVGLTANSYLLRINNDDSIDELTTSLTGGKITVTGGNTAAYTVGTATAKAGDTDVKVPISLDNKIEGGFMGANLVIDYDKENLTLTDVQPGAAIASFSTIAGTGFGSNSTADNANRMYCNDDWTTPITVSGEVMVLTFSLKKSAAGGDYAISVKKDIYNPWFCKGDKWDDSGVTPTVTAGKITVTGGDTNVTSYDELSSAIAGASTDGSETVINIKNDITIASSITLPVGTNIKLVGDGGNITVTSFPAFTDGAAGNVTLSFQDLNIKGMEPSEYTETTAIFTGLTNSILKIYGNSDIEHDGYIATYSKSRNNPTLYIYGGTIKASPHSYGNIDSTKTYLYPTSDISIDGKAVSFSCAAQEGYPVKNLTASVGDTPISTDTVNTYLAGMKSATTDSPYFLKLVDSTATLISLKISVGSGDAATYPVTVASFENGTVTADPTAAASGDTVTLTVAPSDGYQLAADSLTVTKNSGGTVDVTESGDNTYTFAMPDEAVTVSAAFEAAAARVDAATWDDIANALANATADTVINLTVDVTTPGDIAYTLESQYKITITSENGSKLILSGTKDVTVQSNLTLRDITVVGGASSNKCFAIKTNGTLNLYNVKYNVQSTNLTNAGFFYISDPTAVVNVYGLESDGGATSFYLSKGNVNICPIGTITIPAAKMTSRFVDDAAYQVKIIPQKDYMILTAKLGTNDIKESLSGGDYSIAKSTSGMESLSIAVRNSSAATNTVTVASIENGTVTADTSSAAAGETVTLMAAPSDGYQLAADSLTVMKNSGGTVAITEQTDGTYTFTMPDEAVTVSAQFAVKVAAPTFSVAAGKVAANTQVTLSTTTEGASIYYTTDETTPSSTNGTLYSSPVSITADTTFKAIAVLDGNTTSDVATAAYTVDTTPYSLYVHGNNFTYSIWVNGTALTEDSTANNTSKEYMEAAKPGDTVEFTVSPLDGYEMTRMVVTGYYYTTSWTITPAYDESTGKYSLTMPIGWVSVSAETSAVKTVTVADGITGGTVITDAATTSGSVTVTATPDQGKHLKSISYSYDGETWTKVVSTQVTFTPTANVMVKAEFAEGVDISISTADQLAEFAAAVNAGDAYVGTTVTLTSDIALTGEWTPIGIADIPFAGTFDGNGKIVSGLLITRDSLTYAGLFGKSKGTIQNLTVSGTISLAVADGSDIKYVGGVAGSAGTLIGCTSVVDIDMERGYVGGVAGEAGGSVTGCKNYGTLTIAISDGTEALGVGGILGGMSSTTESIAGCANYGGITFDGGAYAVTDSKTGVTTTGDLTSGYFGGIVGYTSIPKITNSCNKGSITGDMRMAGGLVGVTMQSLTLTNCYSTGAVTETGDDSNKIRARLGGLVGSSYYSRYDLTLENCYCTGEVTALKSSSSISVGELHCNAVDKGQSGGGNATTTVTNSYGPSQKSMITASQLGSAYQADSQNVNGGYPLLTWENSEPESKTYAVTFSVTPASALVTVYTDAEMQQPVEKSADGYALQMGTYYYKVAAEGYGTETGNFNISIRPVTVTVNMKQAATVTFNVTPSDASFYLADSSGKEITPASSEAGKYAFSLYVGNVYTYTATKDGYNSTTREYTASSNATVTVTLTDSSQGGTGGQTITPGSYTISSRGTYDLSAGDYQSGTITVNTTEPVTLVGGGTGLSSVCEDLHIDCIEGADLTLKDVYISNTDQADNMISFTGSGNTLNFSGVSILDQQTGASGYAMIHVNSSTSLTVTGGTAYFYKQDQGAGIGGNGGAKGSEGQAPEYNGDIFIEDANLFMKNTKQGALLGSGANASSTTFTPGDIHISNSTLNLIGNSRGAVIGGSAGSTGAAKGTDVYVDAFSCININVDYSGAAIGGGGYASGNDSSGGTLYYGGGSIRTYVDQNAVDCGLWPGVTEAGVNDVVITANKVDNSGNAVYLCTLNTSQISKNANSFTVKEGNTVLYSGGLHSYHYVNENLYKTDQIQINYTIDNWESMSDSNLYLYLTGEDHILKVNGETVTVTWDSENEGFTVKNSSGTVVSGDNTNNNTDDKNKSDTTTVTKNVTAKMNGSTGKASVTASTVSSAVSDAIETAKTKGTKAAVELKVAASSGCTELQTTIPSEALSSAASSGISALTISSDLGSATLSSSVLSSVASQAGSADVTVALSQVETSSLTAEQQAQVGDGTVINLSITAGDSAITSFGGETVSFSLPVTATVKSGETVNVYYLNSNNELVLIEGSYDSTTDMVTFATMHLSSYVLLIEDAWTNPFTDAASGDWYYNAVKYVSETGLFNGTTETAFGPNVSMTRAMLVTVLWRMEGDPAAESAGFSDVDEDEWYAGAVNWAAANGVVSGYNDGKFGPDDAVTREQMAVILYRYANTCGYNTTKDGLAIREYSDYASISSWASEAMEWANASGLITGTTTDTLSPADNATRAQVATILMRFMQGIAL